MRTVNPKGVLSESPSGTSFSVLLQCLGPMEQECVKAFPSYVLGCLQVELGNDEQRRGVLVALRLRIFGQENHHQCTIIQNVGYPFLVHR